jgi:hypothetical protein
VSGASAGFFSRLNLGGLTAALSPLLSKFKMAEPVHKSDYATPIPERTAPTDWPRTIQFSILFNLLIISTNISQFVFFLLLYPLEDTRSYYERCICYSKSVFSRLIVAISQLFAPTKIVISCSDENGNYLDPEKLVKRNKKGRVIEFSMPDRSVWIANHQVRCSRVKCMSDK